MVTSASQEPQHGVQSPPGESGCVYIVFIQASIMQVAWLVSRWKLHCTTRSVWLVQLNEMSRRAVVTGQMGLIAESRCSSGTLANLTFPGGGLQLQGGVMQEGWLVLGCIVELDWGYLSLNHLEYHWYWWLLYWILQVSGYLSILKHGEIYMIISGTINGN